MGTLELRITATKPGLDGKLVRIVITVSKLLIINVFNIFIVKNRIAIFLNFHYLFADSLSPDLNCAAPVMLFTSELVLTPAPP